jgi:hypothetical protein
MYMSYDVTKPPKEQKYFKLADIADCKAANNQDVTVKIPTYLPAGAAILRFEWIALHVRPMSKFVVRWFIACVEVCRQKPRFPQGT